MKCLNHFPLRYARISVALDESFKLQIFRSQRNPLRNRNDVTRIVDVFYLRVLRARHGAWFTRNRNSKEDTHALLLHGSRHLLAVCLRRLCCDELYSSPHELHSIRGHPFSLSQMERSVLACIDADPIYELLSGKRTQRSSK